MLSKEQIAAKLQQEMAKKANKKSVQINVSDKAAKHINKIMIKPRKP